MARPCLDMMLGVNVRVQYQHHRCGTISLPQSWANLFDLNIMVNPCETRVQHPSIRLTVHGLHWSQTTHAAPCTATYHTGRTNQAS